MLFQQINHYPLNELDENLLHSPVDTDLSYMEVLSPFEQLGSGS